MKTRLWLYNESCVRKEQRRVWPASVYLGGSVAIVTFASPWCDAWWPEENPPGARSCPLTVHLSRHFVSWSPSCPLFFLPAFIFTFLSNRSNVSLFIKYLRLPPLYPQCFLLYWTHMIDAFMVSSRERIKMGTNRMVDTILVAFISLAMKLNCSIVKKNKN